SRSASRTASARSAIPAIPPSAVSHQWSNGSARKPGSSRGAVAISSRGSPSRPGTTSTRPVEGSTASTPSRADSMVCMSDCGARHGPCAWAGTMKESPARQRKLQSAWVAVRGLPLHARVATAAPPDAPAVVLVHGIGVASRYFVPLAERLAPHARVYALDLPGFGASAKPHRILDLPELAEALALWLDAAGLARVAVLGNSVGCQIVAHLAVCHPARVERLVLAGPTMDPRARTAWQAILRWLQNNRHERLAQLPITVRDYRAAGLARLLGTFQQALRDHIEDQLPRIQAPTLVVRGERDAIVPQAWAEAVVRRLPDAELAVVPRAAHTVNFNAPDELARIVLPFLRGDGPGLPAGVPAEAPIAGFDSASAMLRATARALQGQDFPLVGTIPPRLQPVMQPVGLLINCLPKPAREQVYIWSGRQEAI